MAIRAGCLDTQTSFSFMAHPMIISSAQRSAEEKVKNQMAFTYFRIFISFSRSRLTLALTRAHPGERTDLDALLGQIFFKQRGLGGADQAVGYADSFRLHLHADVAHEGVQGLLGGCIRTAEHELCVEGRTESCSRLEFSWWTKLNFDRLPMIETMELVTKICPLNSLCSQ